MMWILVYTKAKQENRANFNLQNQGFVTFLPLISSQKRTEKSKQLSPVFPRYIFVKIDPDLENWITIKSTLGVEKIVMFADKLTSVPNDIIKAIRSKLVSCQTMKSTTSSLFSSRLYQKEQQLPPPSLARIR